MIERISVSEVGKDPEIIQLSYGMESANTYLIVSRGHAVIVDVCSEDVRDELIRRGLIPDYVILTHEHVDHLWGLNAVRREYPDLKVIAQEQCSMAIGNPKANKAAEYHIYAVLRFGSDYNNKEALNRSYCCRRAEVEFENSYVFNWENYSVEVIHTPGHSPGSCLVFFNNDRVFSGDTMLNEDTFLRFNGGDEEQFTTVTIPVINAIKPDADIFPGHGLPFRNNNWRKRTNG